MKKIILVLACFILLTSFHTNNEVTFEAKFEIKNNKLEVKDTKGFTFTMMAFTKRKDIYFNQSGMINYNLKSEITNSDFIIKINRRNNRVILEGIKNTNWKTLEFKNQAIIDQNGILK